MLKEKILSAFSEKRNKKLIAIGFIAVFISLAIIFLTFLPVLRVEINYLFHKTSENVVVETKNAQDQGKKNVIFPVDENFGIVIPKINANSKVVENVDPYNEAEYQWALTKGLAHARGTSVPGEDGSIFIFSHSAVNFYEAEMYNAVFYLLSKLEPGDEIYLFYKGEKFKYIVSSKVMADSSELSYLTQKTDKKMLTLMTCWPPGTTLQRLIILAEMIY